MGTLVLVKEQLLTGHDSHYAGGIHLFGCLASTLSQQAGWDVHTFSTATKAVIMHHAVTHSLFTQLHTHYTSCGVEVVSWEHPSGLYHHCVVPSFPPSDTTAAASASSTRSSAKASELLSAVAETCSLAATGKAGLVLLDIDTLQHAAVPTTFLHSMSAATPGKQAATLHPTSNTADLCAHHQHNTLQRQQQQQEEELQESVPFMLALAQQCCGSCPAPLHPAEGHAASTKPAHPQHKQQQHEQQGEQCCGSCPAPQHAVGHTVSTQLDHPQHQQQSQQQQGDQELEQPQLAHVNCCKSDKAAAWQLLAFVQNLHHLPFGPCGTGPRSPAVLQAWQSVSGVVCVSDFVRSYIKQHALPQLPQLQPQDLHTVHPAAFGVWGPGLFENMGSTAASRLWDTPAAISGPAPAPAAAPASSPGGADGPASACAAVSISSSAGSVVAPGPAAASQPIGAEVVAEGDPAAAERGMCKTAPAETTCVPQAGADDRDAPAAAAGEWLQQQGQAVQEGHEQQQRQQQPQGQQWQQTPVIGMLKLTREKGSELFLALAEHLPQLHFKAVCAEPQLLQEVAHAGCSNVQLVQPVADVSAILQGIDLLLVPSILHEAFGMVVLDAMLYGIPVLVAAAGALQEAVAGTAAGLPVALVQFPPLREPQPGAAAEVVAAAGALQEAAAGTTASLPVPIVQFAPSQQKQPAATAATATAAALSAEGLTSAEGCEDGVIGAGDSTCMCCWLEGQRSWDKRVYPPLHQEHVRIWAGAIQDVLSSREGYLQASSRSRKAAQQVADQQPVLLAAHVQWLRELLCAN